MTDKNSQTNLPAGVISGKFTGGGALPDGLSRSVSSQPGYFKLEKRLPNLPVSYEQRSLPASVDKKNQSLVPMAGVVVALLFISFVGVKSLSVSPDLYSSVPTAVETVNVAFNSNIDTSNLISNVKEATVVMPEKVKNNFVTASIFSAVDNLFSSLWIWCRSIFSLIVDNWKKFLGMTPIDKSDPASSLTPELQAKLKQEITDELYNRLISGESTPAGFTGNRTGISISPSTGSTSSDEAIKQKIRNIFSDKVDISFDKSGTSGVITPQFSRMKNGSNYVFVLTPLR